MEATLRVIDAAAHEPAMVASGGEDIRRPPSPVSLPSPSRTANIGRRQIRMSRRIGFELDHDPHAERRTVAIPEVKLLNNMQDFGSPALTRLTFDTKRVRGEARRAAVGLVNGERQTFCTESRDVLEKAIVRLDLDEP